MYTKAYSLKEWLKLMESKYVNITDIVNMSPRESKRYLCLDINFFDLVDKSGNVKKAVEFFKYNYIFDYIHKGGLSGTRIWSCETMSCMIEIEEFIFDLNYNKKNNLWCQLHESGNLVNNITRGNHIIDRNKQISINPDINETWRDYPFKTLVGCKGPIIAWEDVLNGPLIYYSEDDNIDNNKIDNNNTKNIENNNTNKIENNKINNIENNKINNIDNNKTKKRNLNKSIKKQTSNYDALVEDMHILDMDMLEEIEEQKKSQIALDNLEVSIGKIESSINNIEKERNDVLYVNGENTCDYYDNGKLKNKYGYNIIKHICCCCQQ